MMKMFTIFISFLSAWYCYSLLPDFSEQADRSSKSVSLGENFFITMPGSTTEVEKRWIEDKLKEQAEAVEKEKLAKQLLDKPKEPKQNTVHSTLSINGIDFQLIGIFSDANTSFVILISPNNETKRVSVGQLIMPNVTLLAVSSDKITFDNNGQRAEFNLFKRNKNA